MQFSITTKLNLQTVNIHIRAHQFPLLVLSCLKSLHLICPFYALHRAPAHTQQQDTHAIATSKKFYKAKRSSILLNMMQNALSLLQHFTMLIYAFYKHTFCYTLYYIWPHKLNARINMQLVILIHWSHFICLYTLQFGFLLTSLLKALVVVK